MDRRRLAALIAAALALPACPSDDSSDGGGAGGAGGSGGTCTKPTYGDPTQPIEIQAFAGDGGGLRLSVDAGSKIPLIVPPQGGRVLFLGAKVRNLSSCGVQVKGVLRDAMGKTQVDKRTTNLLSTGDGWAETDSMDFASLANVNACPNGWSEGNAFGPMQIEIEVVDAMGRKATVVRDVVLECPDDAGKSFCECQCKAGYVLGQPCP